MQATFFPVSFNGVLGDALDGKSSKLALKQIHLEALNRGEARAEQEVERQQAQINNLFDRSEHNVQRGYDTYDQLIIKAESDFDLTTKEAKDTFDKNKDDAKNSLLEAQRKTEAMVESLRVLADHADEIRLKSEKNLKEVAKTAKPLKAAVRSFAENVIEESEEVADSVVKARNTVNDANRAVNNSLKEIAKLERQEIDIIRKMEKEAEEKRKESKRLRIFGKRDNKAKYLSQLAEIKEMKAKSLDDAREAYRKSINEAENTLNEYLDLADADRKRSYQMQDKLDEMKTAVSNIKLQASLTRATNLPALARAAIELGDIGEGATRAVVSRVIKTLTNPDWYATIRGKLCAIGAAGMFIVYGSENQQIATGAGITLNADKIVDKTESVKVMEELRILDSCIDKLDITA